MLFFGKENVFMCLVAFQKKFRKIFSGVWLCSWKYHRKHIFYLLLTFSRLPNEYTVTQTKPIKKIIKSGHIFSQFLGCQTNITISFIPQYRNTYKTQEKNHQIQSNWEKKEEREARRRDAMLHDRCGVVLRDQRSAVLHDRDRLAFGVVIVWLSSAWPTWGRSVSVAGSKLSFFLSLVGWIGALVLSLTLSVFCIFSGWALFVLFFLSLSLCCSLHSFSHSLCVLRDSEMIWSENESVKSFPGQRHKFRSTGSDFLENFIFRCCQTRGLGGKWFPEIIFSQNKHTLSWNWLFAENIKIKLKV